MAVFTKSILPFLILIHLTSFLPGQKVTLLKIDALEKRLAGGKDTTYIINFWATWCKPCVEELREFEKLNSEYKNEKLKVLLISVDYKSQFTSSVIPFVNKKKLKSEVFLLDEPDQQEYIDRIDSSWSGSIPASLFVKNNKRKFSEKQFTYEELKTAFQTF